MPPVIETPRLRLRKARLEDLDDLFAVFSDPRAMRYWDTLPHDDIALTEGFLAFLIASAPPDGDDFVVERDGRAIGKAGCWKRGEIGFILHPDHWGQGIGREALGAVIPHVFASLDLDRLEADVDPRNAASIALLTRLGFRETGRAERTFLVGDEWCDSVYFALDRADWRGGARPVR
jgi:RimJ/RimL family protein N-acetyltransferase